MSALPLAVTPSPTQLIIILVIVLLLFGAKRLPDLAGAVGRSIREFRKASEDPDTDADEPAAVDPSSSDKTES